MKISSLIILLLLILSFAGCEQVIDPNDKNFETELFVYGLLGPGELPKIFFTETQPNEGWFEQVLELGYPKGLEVEVLAEGQTQTLTEKEGWNTFYNYYTRGIDTSYNVFYEGDTPMPDSGSYQLSLQYQGKEIKATTQIPKRVALDSVYNKVIKYEDSSGAWENNVLVAEFTDRVGSTENYRVQFGYRGIRVRSKFDPDGQNIGYDSTYVNENHFFRSISDQGLDGQKIERTISPYVDMIPQTETLPDGSTRSYYPVWLVLETQSEALTTFLESAEAQAYNYGDPFVEPVFLKGNIEGGLGVFGAYQRSDTVWTKYYPY